MFAHACILPRRNCLAFLPCVRCASNSYSAMPKCSCCGFAGDPAAFNSAFTSAAIRTLCTNSPPVHWSSCTPRLSRTCHPRIQMAPKPSVCLRLGTASRQWRWLSRLLALSTESDTFAARMKLPSLAASIHPVQLPSPLDVTPRCDGHSGGHSHRPIRRWAPAANTTLCE